jgi:glutamate synthase domain-containing protein 2
MRELSGGKPVGFKLAIGQKHQFIAMCKAMLETGIVPDFITVDGSEGGTGAADAWYMDHDGVPLKEALLFVHNTLNGFGLRERVKIIASGGLFTPDQAVMAFGLGADLINTARGFMLAAGCIRAGRCGQGDCPSGVAAQKESHIKALHVETKAPRITNYQSNYMHGIQKMLGVAGVEHVDDLSPDQIEVQTDEGGELLSEQAEFLSRGSLLQLKTVPGSFFASWAKADPHSFKPKGGFKKIKPQPIPVQIKRRSGSDETVA